MTAAPWSVKGIDPKAREIAKDLARRSGMTLGEWLNSMILDDEAVGAERLGVRASQAAPSARRSETLLATESFLSRSAFAQPAAMSGAEPRFEAPRHPADESGRVTEALERLSDRIEIYEQRSASTINTIDQSVRGALSRLDEGERDRNAVAARFEGALQELQSDHARLADRLRGLEIDDGAPTSGDAIKTLESAMSKMAGYVYEGETATREALSNLEARLSQAELAAAARPSGENEALSRIAARLEAAESRTTDALRQMGSSFQALEGRLNGVEADGAKGVERRLETMAGDLTRQIDQVRSEMAEKLRDAADGRSDRVQKVLGEMTEHVQAAEQRSARAIEQMGREVLNIAEGLGRKIQSVESRSADALDRVGGEVARIGAAMDHRLAHADMVQAQAMEKLGSEIARITERLAERIANAERRNASAIDEVGEQVGRITERIAQRSDRTASDLAERIRQSEERTARLLDDARLKIDASLEASQKKLTDHLAAASPTPVARSATREAFEIGSPFRGDAIPDSVFEQPLAFDAHPEPGPRLSTPLVVDGGSTAPAKPAGVIEAQPTPLQREAAPTETPHAAGFSQDDFDAVETLFREHRFTDVAVDEPVAAAVAASPETDLFAPDAPMAAAASSRPLTTREVIEQARHTARAAAQPEPKTAGKAKPSASLFKGFSLGGKKPAPRRNSSTLQTALVMAGAAAAAGSGLTGYMLYYARPNGPTPARVAQAIADARPKPVGVAEGVAPPTAGGEVRAAVAMAPTPLAEPIADAPPPPDAGALYEDSVRRIEAHDVAGLVSLRKAANLGYAPAQFYLAKLYENGDSGLKKDLVEARRWTERAALGGDRKAMHNMALYAFEGTGGPKNSTTAAQWFRKAADLGLVDSQYNLGRLYEEGFGVSQNAAEAYKWYLIAARAGDAESRSSAQRVKALLSFDAQGAAERSATGYRAASANPSVVLAPGSGGLALTTAQKALSRLGYYQGPADGAASPALRLALTAWQRDQGLQPTGRIDDASLSRLSAFVQ